MASTIPQTAVDKITKARGVMASAKLLIETFKDRLEAARQEILANGATEAELQPLAALSAGLDTDSDDLATAVAANP